MKKSTSGAASAAKKGRLIVASSGESADIFYSTSFQATDPFVYYESGAARGVIVPTLEYGRAQRQCRKGLEVFNREMFFAQHSAGKSRLDMNALLLLLSKVLGISHWEVPSSFPLGYADFLRENGIAVEPSAGLFFPKRVQKSAAEIKMISAAQRLAERAMSRVLALLREASVDRAKRLVHGGEVLSSELVRRAIDLELLAGGAAATGTIVSCGRDSAEPHNLGSGPLRAGEPIVVDIFPRDMDTGYWGDITRSFVKGKAPLRVKRAFEAVRDARDRAKDMICAGLTGAKAYEIAKDRLDANGFRTGIRDGQPYGFIHGLGHGVGLEIHESPRLSPLNPSPLPKGAVVTVEPGVYYKEWGGIRLEDIVVITEKSCECITDFETFLEIP
ncbi:MAG: hypothetical protein A2X49_10860 [Lentisphaerae bacterium GWF2_52_8]|nr:MAG: hypothetical protein A2X49_10860 [Lentisphaerae bacterium GWF2_52_8]